MSGKDQGVGREIPKDLGLQQNHNGKKRKGNCKGLPYDSEQSGHLHLQPPVNSVGHVSRPIMWGQTSYKDNSDFIGQIDV